MFGDGVLLCPITRATESTIMLCATKQNPILEPGRCYLLDGLEVPVLFQKCSIKKIFS